MTAARQTAAMKTARVGAAAENPFRDTKSTEAVIAASVLFFFERLTYYF